MRVDLFDFELPQSAIALRPVHPRDHAKLLCVDGAELQDLQVKALPQLLQAGDALVFNDTKVFPAELHGVRVRGDARAKVSFNLHKKTAANRWLSFARPAKKLMEGDRVEFGSSLTAMVLSRHEAEAELEFSLQGEALQQAFADVGTVPLPPYIGLKREADAQDRDDYQTVYAKHDGSVAAPTAGLHFTPKLLAQLKDKGVSAHYVTLHVGAGTFLPVKTDDTESHVMHSEWGSVSASTADALNAVRAKGKRVVCVGTTSLRLLESASAQSGVISAFEGDTAIFITPGYRFLAADLLLTNFHLPRSTLFMLVSAFAGLETMQHAYAHAIKTGYRFYSYGDACLLYPKTMS